MKITFPTSIIMLIKKIIIHKIYFEKIYEVALSFTYFGKWLKKERNSWTYYMVQEIKSKGPVLVH